MSDEECIRFASQELVKMGIISDEKAVLDAHRERLKKHIRHILIPMTG